MRCPAILADSATGGCSHSKLIALAVTLASIAVFAWANLTEAAAIVGWEAWIGINIAAMANAQASKFLSNKSVQLPILTEEIK